MQDYRLKPEHRKGYTPPKDEPPLEDPRDKEVRTHIYYQPDTWGFTRTKRKFTGILALRGAEVQELGTKPSISPDGTPCITTLPEPAPKVDKWEWRYDPLRMQYTLRMADGSEHLFTAEYLSKMERWIRIATMSRAEWSVGDYSMPIQPIKIDYIEVENPFFVRYEDEVRDMFKKYGYGGNGYFGGSGA